MPENFVSLCSHPFCITNKEKAGKRDNDQQVLGISGAEGEQIQNQDLGLKPPEVDDGANEAGDAGDGAKAGRDMGMAPPEQQSPVQNDDNQQLAENPNANPDMVRDEKDANPDMENENDEGNDEGGAQLPLQPPAGDKEIVDPDLGNDEDDNAAGEEDANPADEDEEQDEGEGVAAVPAMPQENPENGDFEMGDEMGGGDGDNAVGAIPIDNDNQEMQ